MKKVIDADNNKILERFLPEQTQKMLEKYIKIGKWEDVGIDIDGDIVLWEKL